MAYNSSSLHLEIAEWILEQGRAVTVYEVVRQFGITMNQANGFFMILKNDVAIKSKSGSTVLAQFPGRLNKYHVREIMITAIDREQIIQRHTSSRGHGYEHHPVESVSTLSPDEKWKWIINHSRRKKDKS